MKTRKNCMQAVVQATSTVLIVLAVSACQHFVKVHTVAGRPVFSWPGDVPAAGLTVRPVLEECDFDGPHSPEEQVWWHVSGELRSPVTYGVVPPGATEHVPARPFMTQCDDWVVTVTDQAMRGESTEFSP